MSEEQPAGASATPEAIEESVETHTEAPESATDAPTDDDAPKKTTRKKRTKKSAVSKKKTTKKTTRKKTTKKKTSAKADPVAEDEPSDDANAEEAPSAEPAAEQDDASAASSSDEDDARDAEPDGDATDEAKPAKKKSRSRSKKKTSKRTSSKKDSVDPISGAASDAHRQMIVNYIPGEECRVAMVEDGLLEEIHEEKAGAVSHVGNVYVGKITNVEAGIQAAFVDFGLEENGFLHIQDVHPKYFPGGEDTERVGKKTPRRERPPIQACFKRGQEVVVQVLKEGINTKGPTLTSYLSIPGRYLVMLPDMDKVGVSRKVEDEDTRRVMRKQLDQLELPGGFGFILRTAGMDRSKTELKRDLAYLQRLWKDIEKRQNKGRGPRLLYAESDLLMRSLRDVWTNDVAEIIIDDEGALTRAARFMKIVSPRSSTRLLRYDKQVPLFHAFGLEDQLSLIRAREVPLPSGGSLVIDETEAMIAIDVNSGKMRDKRDAETTAFRTNMEAVDEICRQLRLRDLGGLVMCDLIDMMNRQNRKSIENRFRDRLKRDRAASKTLPISQFGIVEMTRQRMRGSLRSQHFTRCPTCEGRAHLQRPASVASDAVRELAAVLYHDRVAKVEMVVSPRVAGELLSAKRLTLTRMELRSGKNVDVRVSEDLRADRIVFYAYDPSGADVDLARLPKPKAPKDLVQVETRGAAEDWIEEDTVAAPEDEVIAKTPDEDPLAGADPLLDGDPLEVVDADDEDSDDKPKKKRRRRRRRGKRKSGDDSDSARSDGPGSDSGEASNTDSDAGAEDAPDSAESQDGETDEDGQPAKKKRRRRRRRRKKSDDGEGDSSSSESGDSDRDEKPAPKRSPKKEPSSEPKGESSEDAKPKPRALFGSRRKLKPGEAAAALKKSR